MLQLKGRWREAAASWRIAGCPYEAALALADADDEACQRRALEEVNGLGVRSRVEAASTAFRLGIARMP